MDNSKSCENCGTRLSGGCSSHMAEDCGIYRKCWTPVTESVTALTETIASLERSEKSAPESCRAEIRDIIEEVVYLRNRISQGVTK